MAIDGHKHAATVDAGASPFWVNGDRARLIQIVGNLLHNSAKFTLAGGQIRVTLTADENNAVITVADNGPGIRPERLPHIFNRFEQVDTDTNKTHGGLGLGLSLVKELTHLQHGIVSASSTGIRGEGATFEIRLPRIKQFKTR